jgi:hypothetical protein
VEVEVDAATRRGGGAQSRRVRHHGASMAGRTAPARLVLAAAAARTLPPPSSLPRRDARVVERPSTVAWQRPASKRARSSALPTERNLPGRFPVPDAGENTGKATWRPLSPPDPGPVQPEDSRTCLDVSGQYTYYSVANPVKVQSVRPFRHPLFPLTWTLTFSLIVP